MACLYINGRKIEKYTFANLAEIHLYILNELKLQKSEYYLEKNSKRLNYEDVQLQSVEDIKCFLRVHGGKGGFGSMLRAIGAQIEKTTNREACRDLSGRRLRDINEEKRIKTWLEKRGTGEDEKEKSHKRKIEKLLSVQKTDTKTKCQNEGERTDIAQKVSDSIDAGLKNIQETVNVTKNNDLKRKISLEDKNCKIKKKKSALWVDEVSGTDSSDDEDASDSESSGKAIALKNN